MERHPQTSLVDEDPVQAIRNAMERIQRATACASVERIRELVGDEVAVVNQALQVLRPT